MIYGSWSYIMMKYVATLSPDALYNCIPGPGAIFTSFFATPFEEVKVIIVGQEPYQDDALNDGLAFSCADQKPSPTLRNIFKEIRDTDAGYIPPIVRCGDGDLTGWAKQGVFLLNSALTSRIDAEPGSLRKEWKDFTDQAVLALNKRAAPLVFMLWGNDAKQKRRLITNPRHLILEAAHPSPHSAKRGFFGCNHFNLANDFLKKNGQQPIDWERINK